MCGRFAQVVKHNQLKKLIDELNIKNRDEQLPVNFNVAPTQPVGAVISKADERFLTFFRWGLVPSWTKEINPRFPMINVRSDTILEKPTFKTALIRRRCLIPATGFYEWRMTDKQPFFITASESSVGFRSCGNASPEIPESNAKHNDTGQTQTENHVLAGSEPYPTEAVPQTLLSGNHVSAGSESYPTESGLLYFAGIVDYWTGDDGSYIQSCAIITTEPNAVMQPIHERMPVILPPDTWDTWLKDSFTDQMSLKALLVPCPAEMITAYPVSKFVNSIRNNSEECLKQADVI